MEFRVEVKKASVKPCHSRYHPVLSVRYQNADQTGVTSVQLQVLGLGGSRIVCAAPHATDRVWKISEYPQDIEQRVSRLFGPITMDGVKAAGVHRLVELGLKDQAKDPAWVTVLEAEKVDPLPPLSDLVAIQAVFSIALVSKVLSPRDLGQYNLGSRPGAPGCIRELVFVDCNGWEEYEEHQHAAFPNMRKALGFWKTIAHYDEGLKQNLCSIVQTYHNDLEALTVNLRDFARKRLSQECYSNLMHCLVQSQVLGISPEGLLCQFVPVGGRPHNFLLGHKCLTQDDSLERRRAALASGGSCWYAVARQGRKGVQHTTCMCGGDCPSRPHVTWQCPRTAHVRAGLTMPTDRAQERLFAAHLKEIPAPPGAGSHEHVIRKLQGHLADGLAASAELACATDGSSSDDVGACAVVSENFAVTASDDREDQTPFKYEMLALWLLFAALSRVSPLGELGRLYVLVSGCFTSTAEAIGLLFECTGCGHSAHAVRRSSTRIAGDASLGSFPRKTCDVVQSQPPQCWTLQRS